AAVPAPATATVAAAPPVAAPPPAPAPAPAVAPPSPPAAEAGLKPGLARNLLFITFDAFDARTIGLPESSSLQELAARPFQAPIQGAGEPVAALGELWGGAAPLGAELAARGYELHGFLAWNAKGRAAKIPTVPAQVVSGSGRRNAADEAVMRARDVLRTAKK